jgi:type II secretory pathway pseudopilin PulG
MRKGISLVEMVIAIILFAALATIGLKYSKNYINTDLQAMKARAAALTEQASQLTQAYAIYTAEVGASPTAITDLNGSAQILHTLPTPITEITKSATNTYGWDLNTSTGFTNGPTVAFTYVIDKNASEKSDEQYCQIFNREFNSSTELNVTDGMTIGGATAQAAYTALKGQGNAFCWGPFDATNKTYQIMVLVP